MTAPCPKAPPARGGIGSVSGTAAIICVMQRMREHGGEIRPAEAIAQSCASNGPYG